MIVQVELIKRIKDFGLNSYEAKIWTALLSRGVSSAGELSEISNVPRSRTYDVLESLEKKGFIMMKLGKPIKYLAISPNDVVERVKKKIKEESLRQEKQMEDLRSSKILEELSLLHSQGIEMVEPSELAGVIKDRDNIYNHLDLMIRSAEKSIYIVTSEQGFLRKIDRLKKSLKKAKDKGVTIKVLLPTMPSKEDLLESKDLLEVRKLADLYARFIIIDGKEILFTVTDDSLIHPSYDGGMWVNSPYFANSMKKIFELLWDK